MNDFIQSLFTVTILAILTYIIIEMRRNHRDLIEKIKDVTPWLGWTENEDHETPVIHAHN